MLYNLRTFFICNVEGKVEKNKKRLWNHLITCICALNKKWNKSQVFQSFHTYSFKIFKVALRTKISPRMIPDYTKGWFSLQSAKLFSLEINKVCWPTQIIHQCNAYVVNLTFNFTQRIFKRVIFFKRSSLF